MKEKELLLLVVRKLKENFPKLKIDLKQSKVKNIAGAFLDIAAENGQNHQIELHVINRASTASGSLRNPMLDFYISEKMKSGRKIMIITEQVKKPAVSYLQDKNIFFADAAGNVFIELEGLFIFKYDSMLNRQKISQKTEKIFYPAGLKLIFSLLCDNALVNENIRAIAGISQISLGSAQSTIKGLINSGYVMIKDGKNILIEKEKLFERWIGEFAEKLRPKLFIGRYRFKNFNDHIKWRSLELPADTSWGGEAAAEFLEKSRAGILTLYTSINADDIAERMNLVPDDNGKIEILKKFWTRSHKKNNKQTRKEKGSNIAPDILIYADLINSENERNIETAEKLYEHFKSDQNR